MTLDEVIKALEDYIKSFEEYEEKKRKQEEAEHEPAAYIPRSDIVEDAKRKGFTFKSSAPKEDTAEDGSVSSLKEAADERKGAFPFLFKEKKSGSGGEGGKDSMPFAAEDGKREGVPFSGNDDANAAKDPLPSAAGDKKAKSVPFSDDADADVSEEPLPFATVNTDKPEKKRRAVSGKDADMAEALLPFSEGKEKTAMPFSDDIDADVSEEPLPFSASGKKKESMPFSGDIDADASEEPLPFSAGIKSPKTQQPAPGKDADAGAKKSGDVPQPEESPEKPLHTEERKEPQKPRVISVTKIEETKSPRLDIEAAREALRFLRELQVSKKKEGRGAVVFLSDTREKRIYFSESKEGAKAFMNRLYDEAVREIEGADRLKSTYIDEHTGEELMYEPTPKKYVADDEGYKSRAIADGLVSMTREDDYCGIYNRKTNETMRWDVFDIEEKIFAEDIK